MITAIILTKNEAKNLPKCLESVKWCDQILVIDDGSTDKTVSVAQKAGAQVLEHPLNANYASQRNWALSKVKTTWVLFVDADEVVSDQLADEIKVAITKIEFKGYLISRIDHMWGKRLTHGDVGGVKLLRLARHGAGDWQGTVHETWQVEGRVGTLKNPINHFPHPTMVEFLNHINVYSTLKAKEFHESGKKINLIVIIFGPVWRFILNYFFKLGFLDGTAGFVHAMTMAFYTFLVAGKLWLLYKGIPQKS